MKTYIKIITISILSSFAFMTNAQSKGDRKQADAPWISKDVMRFSNREALMVPHLTVKSIGSPDLVISKEVRKERSHDKKIEAVGNMVSTGYLEWIILKGVQRINNTK